MFVYILQFRFELLLLKVSVTLIVNITAGASSNELNQQVVNAYQLA